jgi:hypothetical protein
MRTIGKPKQNINLDTYEAHAKIPSSSSLELLFLRVDRDRDRSRPATTVKRKANPRLGTLISRFAPADN